MYSNSKLLLALAGSIALTLHGCGAAPEPEAPTAATPPTPVDTLVIEVEDLRDEIVVPAELEPRRRAVIAAEAPGRVQALGGDLGDRVAGGKVLLTVDQRTAKEDLAAAIALDRQARLQRERGEALFERKSITQAQLLDAVTNHEVATARLAAARLALDHTTSVAPWSGEIAARRVEVGDYVVPGQAVIELVDRSTLIARGAVPANDAHWIASDAEVAIELSTRPDTRLPARLVRRAPAIDPLARTLEIEAELEGGLAFPGEPARLVLVRRLLQEVVVVPSRALIELEHGTAVYVVESGVARRRAVELGVRIGERVVVTSGLAAGDRVVVRGQDRVADGQSVAESQR